ncbi:MAG: glycosyltransferase N-terminal domain-containing protein [Akkermansia sp.]
MKRFLVLSIYYLIFPIFLLISLPGYLIKMWRRGGVGSGLLERFGYYRPTLADEPQGGLYVHAVSVGEAFIALKFIREWQKTHPEAVVLAVSTSTGHQVARAFAGPQLRVVYAPLDLVGLPERCLSRFQPTAVALIEAELWPHFAQVCSRRHIPLLMLNARLSPRSEGRYAKVRGITQILFAKLNAMATQNENDAQRFANIGVKSDIIHVIGSIKFDVLGDLSSEPRADYAAILDDLRDGKPVVLAASTHAAEEAMIATAIREAGAFPLIVPRHAERRDEVMRDLRAAGFNPILRTQAAADAQGDCYVCDTTGELRDWTQLAQLVIIGKSFLAKGGQNPVEAIAARIPVITGPDMSNFADLVKMLQDVNGISVVESSYLCSQISRLLQDAELRQKQCEAAYNCLAVHAGATARSVGLVEDICQQMRS